MFGGEGDVAAPPAHLADVWSSDVGIVRVLMDDGWIYEWIRMLR